MMNDRDDTATLRGILRDVLYVAPVAILVGVAWIAFLAPRRLLEGNAKGRKDAAAGVVGLLYWTAVLSSVAQVF